MFTSDALRGSRVRPVLAAAAACALLSVSAAVAEDLQKRWSLAGRVSFISTKDNVRSNSTLVLGNLGDDGIPYTGDPNEDLDCDSVYCDPRPDDLTGRYIRVHDAAQYNLEVGYGVASWLTIRLDAGYSQSEIGPIDFFLSDHYPRPSVPSNPSLTSFRDRSFIETFSAGKLTQVPVSLSGVIRFRVKRQINPYLVLGAGKIFTNVDRSDDLGEINERIASQRIRGVSNEVQRNVVPISILDFAFDARIPFIWDMVPRASNGFQAHAGAGLEYFFTDRISLAFEARYLHTNETLDLDLGNEDQINVLTWSEEIFREDGSVRYFTAGPNAPNPFCYQTGYRGLGCRAYIGDTARRVDPEGDGPFGRPVYKCPAQGDFDDNGQLDLCYGTNVAPSPAGFTEPRGDIIVQGGRINLSNFTVGVGIRLHF